MENISKFIVAKDSGLKVAYVLDVCLDFEKFEKTGYYVVDSETESVYFLKNENIVAKSKNFLIIENVSKLEYIVEISNTSLIGREVISFEGEEFGKIENLFFKKNKLIKFATQMCELLPKNIVSIGEDVVFVSFKRGRKTVHQFEVFQKVEIEPKVVIQSENVAVPEKINLSSNYYIGKLVLSDIIGYNNERIISAGDVINKDLFEKAKKHNKINQLFFALKR